MALTITSLTFLLVRSACVEAARVVAVEEQLLGVDLDTNATETAGGGSCSKCCCQDWDYEYLDREKYKFAPGGRQVRKDTGEEDPAVVKKIGVKLPGRDSSCEGLMFRYGTAKCNACDPSELPLCTEAVKPELQHVLQDKCCGYDTSTVNRFLMVKRLPWFKALEGHKGETGTCKFLEEYPGFDGTYPEVCPACCDAHHQVRGFFSGHTYMRTADRKFGFAGDESFWEASRANRDSSLNSKPIGMFSATPEKMCERFCSKK